MSGWIDDEVSALGELTTRFIEREALPHRQRWLDQGFVDRDFWYQAGELGLLCPSIPAEYGGGGGTIAHDLAVFRAPLVLTETGFGVGNAVHSGVVAHYLNAYGTEEQKHRWLPGMTSGAIIGAIAMTEPDGGSDLQSIRTTAVRDGDHYLVNGSKTFVSNGLHADIVILVVKTRPDRGADGVSLLVVETHGTEGFAVGRRLDKVGLRSQDTVELSFTDMRVPAANLLGDQDRGFRYAMAQLARERLILADIALAVAEEAVVQTVDYAKTRQVFGAPLFEMQNTRFELARCATLTRTTRAFVDQCVEAFMADRLDAASASMAKAHATEVQGEVLDRCVQLFGGYGFMLEYPVARMYADARGQRIYGGANEVMRELIARSL
ncbi:acyl-CoA dehydrogenase family protein [Mycolicibacterium thermoresistibile]